MLRRTPRPLARLALPLGVLLLLAPAVRGQGTEREREEARLAELKAQITALESRISRTRAEEQSALEALEELDEEVKLREALVTQYRQRLTGVARETEAITRRRAELLAEIARLREGYRARARSAYMRGGLGDLALILSATSINQALIRARYLRRFSEIRRAQLAQIQAARSELAAQEEELRAAAVRTQELLRESQAEQATLASRRREREALATRLRQERSSLQGELAQRQANARRLEARIQDLIAAEVARREAEAAAARRANPVAAARDAENVVRLTGSFRSNRGRLPWPAPGVVTGGFGLRTHPVYGTKTTSPGIEVSTAAAATVRAVFDGTVSRVFVMPGYGTCVMVSHGDYTTVYGNLSEVSVGQGQTVQGGQVLGRAGTPDAPLGAAVFFALYTPEKQATDPTAWLGSR